MALSDRPKIDYRPAYHVRGCKLGRWAATLPEEDRATLVAWLQDPNIKNAAIAQEINADDDYDVFFTAQQIAYHRAGMRGGLSRGCTCGPL